MSRRIHAAAAIASICLLAGPAAALDRRAEAVAVGALKKAADDYLGTDYAAGAARLQRAIRECSTSRCSPATRVLLLRDLGTMQFRKGDLGAAKKTWAEALKAKPDLELNPDYETPDLRAVWDEVKASVGALAHDGGDAADQPSGDFTHTPAVEGKIDTPLPVYVEYPGNSTVARVIVKYRGAGAETWSRAQLKRMGSGWGGVIPCGDVKLGAMRYWIQGFDDGGDPIASSGDPRHPYSVPIREEISGEAPRLPGRAPPEACSGGNSDTGESSTEDEDAPAAHEGPAVGSRSFARIWVGIAAELPELLQLPSGNDLCKLNSSGLPANSAGAFCTNPNGTDFPSRASPAQNDHLSIPGEAGHSDGGVHVGDLRVMGAFDYALSANFLLGARFGYVFNAYSGQAEVSAGHALASRIHLEARATYLFGDAPLAHVGFAPMVFAGTGVSEFDGHVTGVVSLDNVAGQQPVNIWVADAPFFVALGGGIRYQFSPRAAFTAAARLNTVIGGGGVLLTYGPEIAVLYGF